jgi:hypothetical protein
MVMRVKIGLQSIKSWRGQSLVELAIILPALLFILLGLVEVAFFMVRYMDLLDLTRDAARAASLQKDFSTEAFYTSTANYFLPPPDGINRYALLDPAVDDVVISIYTVTNNAVSDVWPASGYWSKYDNYSEPCVENGTVSAPYYSESVVNAFLSIVSNALPNKGFVAVEVFYCYHQVLNLVGKYNVIPNPLRMHAYTLFPLPAAAPTPIP